MRFFSVVLFLACAMALSVSATADDYPVRTWTNDKGETIDAKLIRVTGATATLDQNGNLIPAPISRLSDADKEWIKKVRELNRWREWTMLDSSTRRAKLESVEGDTITLKDRELNEEVELKLDGLSDADRDLIAEVYGTSNSTTARQDTSIGLGGRSTVPTKSTYGSGQTRDWTDVNGKTITAEYRGTEGNKIVLFFKDREWQVPLTQFSLSDQQWVDQQRQMDAAPSRDQFAPAAETEIASAGGNSFDPASDAIRGRMNPGFDGTGSDSNNFDGARNQFQPGAIAQQEEPEPQEPPKDYAQLEQERLARLQREMEGQGVQSEQAVQEQVASASPPAEYSPSYDDEYEDYEEDYASDDGYTSDDDYGTDFGSPSYGDGGYGGSPGGPNAFGVMVMLLGALIAAVGGIWLMVVAAQESILWLLGCWFIPFVSLIFVATHFDKAGRPFLINICGVGIMFLGVLLGAM